MLLAVLFLCCPYSAAPSGLSLGYPRSRGYALLTPACGLSALRACFPPAEGIIVFYISLRVSNLSVYFRVFRGYIILSQREWSVKKDPLPIAPRINLVFSLKDYQSFFSLRGPRGEGIIPRTQLRVCFYSFRFYLACSHFQYFYFMHWQF